MKRHLLLIRSVEMSEALASNFHASTGGRADLAPRCLLGLPEGESKGGTFANAWVVNRFSALSDWIDAVCGVNGPREATVIVELEGPDILDPKDLDLVEGKGWDAVVAMLICAFPEIRWVFHYPFAESGDRLYNEAHLLGKRGYPCEMPTGFEPLFDPTGLRQDIKGTVRKAQLKVQTRANVAVAIDEEREYAYFNAYAAYRFGYLAHTVVSLGMADFLFGEHGSIKGRIPSDPLSLLSFEDVFLSFPDAASDHEPDRPIDKLMERYKRWFKTIDEDALELAKFQPPTFWNWLFPYLGHQSLKLHPGWNLRRIIQTASERRLQDPSEGSEKGITRSEVKGVSRYEVKPIGGLFDLWKGPPLFRSKRWRYVPRFLARSERYATAYPEGFQWPPVPTDGDRGSHSAPGRLLLIAQRLADRAGTHLSGMRSVPDAIYGAVCANEALEIVACRPPTFALEALTLRHRFEVMAECMFLGIAHDIEVEARIKELERDVEAIGVHFSGKDRHKRIVSSKLGIVNELTRVFRDYNQFDEEMRCRRTARYLEVKKYWFSSSTLNLWKWVATPFRFYTSLLLNGVPNMLLSIGSWIAGFTVLYRFCTPDPNQTSAGWSEAFGHALWTFVGHQPSTSRQFEHKHLAIPWGHNVCDWAPIITVFAVLLGLLHFGVLVSHMYSMISKR